MNGQLIHKFNQCIVYLAAIPGVSEGGTGFFVAPGTIVTCLDTIAPTSAIGAPAIEERDLEVYWAGKPFTARIDRYAHRPGVNLALLRFKIDQPHDCALLHDRMPHQGSSLYTCGYREASTPAVLRPTFDRQTGPKNRHMLQFVSTQDTQGFNGAPLLDLGTGGVCGIVLGPQRHLVVLRNILRKYFNLAEIHEIYFELGINHEEFPTDGHSRKIERLITNLYANGQIAELLHIIARERPNADLRELDAVTRPTSTQTVEHRTQDVPESSHLCLAIPTATILFCYPDLINAQRTFFEQEWRAGSTDAWMHLLSAGQKLDTPSAFQPTQLPIPPCPFPGLRPFEKSEHTSFHGRTAEINQIKGALDRFSLVTLIGQSGSGKTSIIRAGILPIYEKNPAYMVLTLAVPGNQPLENLRNLLQGDPEQGEPIITKLLTQQEHAQRIVLIIDQFEQWLILTHRKEMTNEWNHFIQAIKQLCADRRVCVLITARSDFYGELRNTDLLQQSDSILIDIDPLRGDKLRDAIRCPAEHLDVRVEASLIERLVAETDPQGKQPGALPLLQEVLRRIWTTLQRPTMTLDSYEQIGKDGRSGMLVAIEQQAELAWQHLGSATMVESTEQRAARNIFLKLVVFTDALTPGIVRRPCPTAQLFAANEQELFERTLKELQKQRLLVMHEVARTPIAEIAHDALIEHWPRLQNWLKEFRVAIQQQRHLEVRTQEWRKWQNAGRRDDGWLQEGELQEALRWRKEFQDLLGSVSDLDELITGTIRHQRTRRWLVVSVVVVAVLLSLSALVSSAFMQAGR